MNIKKNTMLKEVYKNIKNELIEKPIATSGVIVAILVVIAPLLSSQLRGFFLHILESLFEISLKVTLAPLALSLSCLLILFLLIRPKKPNGYYFVDYIDLSWKAIEVSKNKYLVEKKPYCTKHKIRLEDIDQFGYTCGFCGGKAGHKLDLDDIRYASGIVQNMVDAKHDGHITNEA